MPRIPDRFLRCSFYVYRSEQSAKDGEMYGGSGFLVHVASEHEGWVHLYAVTNKHVLDGGFHVLRLNSRDGRPEIIPTSPDSWIHHPGGDDVAALSIQLDSERIPWFSIGTDTFITHERADKYCLGPGDETFLIGRLVTLEGYQKNTPVVRFGNISMLPDEPIWVAGHEREAFLVECRSLSGFSGSPVFVTPERVIDTPDIALDHMAQDAEGDFIAPAAKKTHGPFLLGIDFAHMPLWKPVFEADKETRTDKWVDANTGIACVVPAWRLLTLLEEDEELVQRRKKDDEKIALGKARSKVMLDVKP